jgi:hypothetical protein
MNRFLKIAAVFEMATGLAFVIGPSLGVQLLLGQPLAGVSVVVGRVVGIGLFSLGLAYWPGTGCAHSTSSAMLAHNVLLAAYLLDLGIQNQFVGVLLWPAFVLHAGLAALSACARLAARP